MSFTGNNPKYNDLRLEPMASAPTNPVDGMSYYDTTLGEFRFYEDGAWRSLDAAALTVNPRNFLSNSLFELWQRGTLVTGATDNTFGPDRYKIRNDNDAVIDCRRGSVTDHPDTLGISTDVFEYDITTADAAIGADQYLALETAIEGFNVRDLVDQQVTLSFDIYAPVAGTYSVCFRDGSGSNNMYVSEFTVSAPNTWETKEITLLLSSSSISSANLGNGTGLLLALIFAAGTNLQTATLDTWTAATGFTASTNQTNGISTVGTIRLNKMHLNIGAARPAEHQRLGGSFEGEVEHCQRYYQKSLDIDTVPGTIVGTATAGHSSDGHANSVHVISHVAQFKTKMRSTPTVSTYSISETNAGRVTVATGGTNPNSVIASQNSVEVIATSAASTTRNIGFHFTADAELI